MPRKQWGEFGPLIGASLLQASVVSAASLFQGARIALGGDDLSSVAYFYAQIFLATFLAFLATSYWVAGKGKDIGRVMAWSFPAQAAALGGLALGGSLGEALFPAASGIGMGMFWAARHGYELALVSDARRDKLNGALSLGLQISAVAAPGLVGAMLAILAWGGKEDPFLAVAGALGLLSALGWFVAGKLPGLCPMPWAKGGFEESLRTLVGPKGRPVAIFWLAESGHFGMRQVAFPIGAALAAGSLHAIGGIESAAAAIGWAASAALLPMWRQGSRMAIFSMSGMGVCAGWAFFAISPELGSLMLLAATRAIFQPISDSSGLTISQRGLELISHHDGRMLYPALCAREVAIAIGICAPAALLGLAVSWAGMGPAEAASAAAWATAGVILLSLWAGKSVCAADRKPRG